MSLFHEVPLDRDCPAAGIETHWCGCLNWAPVPVTSNLALAAANYALDHVNSQTEEHRDPCSTFQLDTVSRAAVMAPKKGWLAPKQTNV